MWLHRSFGQGWRSVSFVLSDGAPSAGDVVDKGRVRSLIRSINRREKKAIHTIAFGTTRQSDLGFMRGIARDASGVAVAE